MYLTDSATGEFTQYDTNDTTTYFPQNGNGGFLTEGVGTTDGTKVYAGGRTLGRLFTVDLNTLNDTDPMPISSVSISDAPIASVKKVMMDEAETTLYAIINEGAHLPAYDIGYTNEAVTRIISIDIESMEVTGGVDLMRNNNEPRVMDLSIADDGVTAAVSSTSMSGDQIDIVDLGTMTVSKTIPVVLQFPEDQRLRKLAINADGDTVYAMYVDQFNNDSVMLIVDVASGDIERRILGLGITKPRHIKFGPDGMLYLASDKGLYRIDTSTMFAVKLDTDGNDDVSKVIFNKDGTVLYTTRRGTSTAYLFDVATGDRIDADGDSTDGLVGALDIPGSGAYGHFTVITTY